MPHEKVGGTFLFYIYGVVVDWIVYVCWLSRKYHPNCTTNRFMLSFYSAIQFKVAFISILHDYFETVHSQEVKYKSKKQ